MVVPLPAITKLVVRAAVLMCLKDTLDKHSNFVLLPQLKASTNKCLDLVVA